MPQPEIVPEAGTYEAFRAVANGDGSVTTAAYADDPNHGINEGPIVERYDASGKSVWTDFPLGQQAGPASVPVITADVDGSGAMHLLGTYDATGFGASVTLGGVALAGADSWLATVDSSGNVSGVREVPGFGNPTGTNATLPGTERIAATTSGALVVSGHAGKANPDGLRGSAPHDGPFHRCASAVVV